MLPEAAELLVTTLLTGLSLTISFVHYPGFLIIHSDFPEYHEFHTRNISLLVIPLMLAELSLAATSVFYGRNLIAAIALLLIWAVTFIRAVPLHEKLSRHGYDQIVIRSLIRWHHLRTLLWLIRSGLLWSSGYRIFIIQGSGLL